jgi:hypothetical protein
MLVLVGSEALRHHWTDSVPRKPSDYDLIGTHNELSRFIREVAPEETYPLGANKLFMKTRSPKSVWEMEIAWTNSTAEQFMEYARIDPLKTLPMGCGFYVIVPNLDLLYTLKMSHRYLRNSPHFLKTMAHIRLMRENGAVVRPQYQNWLKRREAETYSYGHPSLKQSKKDFFSGDAIEYLYDHDSIHEAIKLGPKPAYLSFKVDGEEVLTSRAKFDSLPREIQLRAVLEETYVLALERSQIPFPGTDPKWSFDKALEKVCTSITSGWFREFSWENYHEVKSLYDPTYTERLQKALSEGIVLPYQSRLP